jgi:hypothetical protein
MMNLPIEHPATVWLRADPFSLPIYAECFDGVAAEIMGESPYLNGRSAGISLALTRDHTIKTVYLYSEGYEGFSEYTGGLPAKLSFSSSRSDVRAALGAPVMSGEKGGMGIMAIDFSFDRFEDGVHYLLVRYLPGDKAIQLFIFGLCSD